MSATTRPIPSEAVVKRMLKRVVDDAMADPQELPVLYEVVDPDALDALVASMTDGHVSFTYGDYLVTVESSGDVHISSLPSHG